MWPNSQLPVDLATHTEEILNGSLYFFCSDEFDVLLGFACTNAILLFEAFIWNLMI